MNAYPNELRSKIFPNKSSKVDYSSTIKTLQLREDNSTCFDCGCKGTTYYVLNFGTFVCSKCAGILRELHYKVKGISVSLFSEDEKNHAEMMGNEKAKQVWMGLFNYKTYAIPKNQNELKRHLKDKYIHKKYFKRRKDIKRVRFDSKASDSDSFENYNDDEHKDNDDESNEDEDEESEYEEGESSEDDENNDDDDEEEKVKESSKEKEKESIRKSTPLTLIKIKKPHNKILSESMKFSKKAWEDLWEKADLSQVKQVSINEFEFFDKDNNGNVIPSIDSYANINNPNKNLLLIPNNKQSNTQYTASNFKPTTISNQYFNNNHCNNTLI